MPDGDDDTALLFGNSLRYELADIQMGGTARVERFLLFTGDGQHKPRQANFATTGSLSIFATANRIERSRCRRWLRGFLMLPGLRCLVRRPTIAFAIITLYTISFTTIIADRHLVEFRGCLFCAAAGQLNSNSHHGTAWWPVAYSVSRVRRF